MRLKITLAKEPSHKSSATCLSWSGAEEVYSAGDDNRLLSWNVSNNEATRVTEFPGELYPTDLHFLPRIGGSSGKHGDLLLMTSTDGRFHIVNRSGRVEKSVDAHEGAVLTGQWSGDGASLLTGGEDGFVKIWSRGGMLRSTAVSSDRSVYAACWSPDNRAILYVNAKSLVIKPLAPNTKPNKWKAHEGVALCVAWSPASELIVSGGEDRRYRVWDGQGRQLFSSGSHDNPVSSVAWAPSGELFAVGSYDTLRLCDHSGWSRSLEKPVTGCIYKLAWSGDGTQLAGACANGHVLFAHTVDRQVRYSNHTATVVERKTVRVRDVSNDSTEVLEFPERVVHLALRYSHLVLTTPARCYVYDTRNWNTPTIFDLKDGSVTLLLLCEKHLLLIERSTVGVYNYQGRLTASPRWPNMRLEGLRNAHVSLCPDALIVRDASDSTLLHVVDLGTSRSTNETVTTIQHSLPVSQVALDQAGEPNSRTAAVLDRNGDLHVVQVRSAHKVFSKLGGQIQSFRWNAEENMIAAIQDTRLVVWYCPSACFDAALSKLCSTRYDSPELGRGPRIGDFAGNSVSIRRTDGSLVDVPVSPFPALLYGYIHDGKWNDARTLCRTADDASLWACLAVSATRSNADTLDVAEEAYAAINQYDRVFYVQHVKDLPSGPQQMAGAALLGGAIRQAESILIHNGLVFQSILNNLRLFNWNRALDLALKHKTHVDAVLYVRREYLNKLGKEESDEKFLGLRDTIFIDAEAIERKIESSKTR